MRVVKDPSFGTGSHPSELSGCQRGSYCGRTEGVGKQSTRGLEGRYSHRISLGHILARAARHRLAIWGSSPYRSSSYTTIYRDFLSVFLATYCARPEGGYRRYRVKWVSRYREAWAFFFFCKASIRQPRPFCFITLTIVLFISEIGRFKNKKMKD